MSCAHHLFMSYICTFKYVMQMYEETCPHRQPFKAPKLFEDQLVNQGSHPGGMPTSSEAIEPAKTKDHHCPGNSPATETTEQRLAALENQFRGKFIFLSCDFCGPSNILCFIVIDSELKKFRVRAETECKENRAWVYGTPVHLHSYSPEQLDNSLSPEFPTRSTTSQVS